MGVRGQISVFVCSFHYGLGISPLYPGKGGLSKLTSTCSNYKGHQNDFFAILQRPLSLGSSPFHPIREGVCHGFTILARLGLSGVDIAQTCCLRIELTERFYLPLLGDWIKPGKNLCRSVGDSNPHFPVTIRGATNCTNQPNKKPTEVRRPLPPPNRFQSFIKTKQHSWWTFVIRNYTKNSFLDLIFRTFLSTLRQWYAEIRSKLTDSTIGSAISTSLW